MNQPDQLPALPQTFDDWWLRADQTLLDVFKRAFFTGELGKEVARQAWSAAIATERARADALQAERDYLARHIERRSEGMDPMTQMLRARADALEAALLGSTERMNRARNILTSGNPRPDCNWAMLDTATARALLEKKT